MNVYYNDNEPFVAQWLRNLIQAGHLPAGDVDERSIIEVQASDLKGYDQCHFFAGVGGWAYALQLADWGDRPVWTGSCPCQPFSAAGKRQAADDARHLWPHWFRLIRECRPERIFGEQVAGAAGLGWLDVVSTDLEAEAYTVGAVVLGAHSVGAPHLRQRLYFVGESAAWRRGPGRTGEAVSGAEPCGAAERSVIAGLVDDTSSARRNGAGQGAEGETRDEARLCGPECGCPTGWLAESTEQQMGAARFARPDGDASELADADRAGQRPSGGRVRDEWNDPWWGCAFIPCRDGKARPVEPSIFPLASGIPNRVGLLRGAGNSVVPQVAAAFVMAYTEIAA